MRPGEERLRAEPGWLAGASWTDAWSRFATSAWRLETLPVYRVASEIEEVERYLRTGEIAADEPGDWPDRVRGWRAAGKQIGRVHTITSPLSEYLQFEFAYYARNVAAGDEIRILDFTMTPNPGLPAQDFWIFDDELVVLMHYEEDGTQIGREILADVDITPYLDYKQLAIDHSVEFRRYRELMKD